MKDTFKLSQPPYNKFFHINSILSRIHYANNLFDNIPEGEAAILVNNVGMGLPRTTIFETKPQDIEEIIKTNIFS